MRRKTQSGNVVSSHSSALGASSFFTNARIDSHNVNSGTSYCPPQRPLRWRRL